MKFIRKEFIVTTVFDKKLTEKSEILIVLNSLIRESIEFSIIITKTDSFQQESINISFEKAKIKKINENETVDLLILKNGYNTSMNNVKISDIVEVKAITKKYKILDVDSNVTRFDLLDL